MFKVASADPRIMELPIATATAVVRGALVNYTIGTGVIAHAAPTDLDDPIFGVAMEDHDGATAGRESGLLIKVAVPDITRPLILRHATHNVITATAGATTNFTCAGLLPQTDNIWINGYLQVLTCAADSSLVGKRIKITDSTGSTGVLTFDAQPAAFAVGDTARLCPGNMALTAHTWDCDAGGDDIDWDAAAVGEALELVDADPANMVCYFKLRLNPFATGYSAI